MLPVRHWIDDVLAQELAKLDDLLGATRWAEPTSTAGEGEQELMATVRAADASEAWCPMYDTQKAWDVPTEETPRDSLLTVKFKVIYQRGLE